MSDYDLEEESQSEDNYTRTVGFGKLEEEEEDESLDIKPPQASTSVYHRKKSSSRNNGSKRRDYYDRDSGRREHVHGRHEISSYRRNHHHQNRDHKDHREDRLREKHHRRYHETVSRIREVRHEKKHEKSRERGISSRSRHGCEHRHGSRAHRRREKLSNNAGEVDLRERLISKRFDNVQSDDDHHRGSSDDEDDDDDDNDNDDEESDDDDEEEEEEDDDDDDVDDNCGATNQRTGAKRSEHKREIARNQRIKVEDNVPIHKETPHEKAERLEGELRRDRFLKAEREMAERKELYRHELEARRERMNLEKQKERTLEEIAKSQESKRIKLDMEEDSEEEAHNSDDVIIVPDDLDQDLLQPDEEVKGEMRSSASDEETTDEGESDSTASGENESDVDSDDHHSGEENVQRSPIHPPVKEHEGYENKNDIPSVIEERGKLDVKSKEELPPYLPAIQGCRNVDEFQTLNKIEEGSYGVVFRAMDKHTEEVVALKRLKMDKEKEGFPITSLREINTLLKAQHPNIVTVREIVVGSNIDKIFIVMDYVEHDLKSLMATMKQKNQFFSLGEVKCLMQQLLRAVAHLHDNWILHRDIKTSNLLFSHKGILKVGDFGLAREYGSPLKAYTSLVVTLWYRAPELLLGTKKYSTPVDMWSVGCVFAELLSMEPLFQGKSEIEQIRRIFKTLGTPNEEIWPGYSHFPVVQKVKFTDYPASQLRTRFSAMISDVGMNLMNKFLTYDPAQRVTAEDAIHHDYFMEGPLPIDPSMFPTWPAKSEIGHRNVMAPSPKLPSGHEYKGDSADDIHIEGFHMGITEKGHAESGPAFRLKF